MLKKKQNQNLIPQQMILGRIKDMVLSKVLVLIIISAVFMVAYFYGCSFLSDYLKDKAVEIEKNSAYTEMLSLQEEVKELTDSISDLEKRVKSGSSQLTSINIEIERNTKIHDITDYIVTNKPNNITLIMIEDAYTKELYTNSTVDKQVKEYEESLVEAEEDVKAKNETDDEESEIDPEEALGYDPSILINEGGNLSDILIVRGFAADMAVLSEYATTLGSYEGIASYRIAAIESVEVTDYSIYLFDIEIQF